MAVPNTNKTQVAVFGAGRARVHSAATRLEEKFSPKLLDISRPTLTLQFKLLPALFSEVIFYVSVEPALTTLSAPSRSSSPLAVRAATGQDDRMESPYYCIFTHI